MKRIKIFIKRIIQENIIEKYLAHIIIYAPCFSLVLNTNAFSVRVILENFFPLD